MNPLSQATLYLPCFLVCFFSFGIADENHTPFEVVFVDRENDWPIPMVEARTTHKKLYVSDNAGRIAIDDPEVFEKKTLWLSLSSHGYEAPKDGLGFRGARVKPVRGGKQVIKLKRNMVAKRIGRLTGAGRFSESKKLGHYPTWTDGAIVGCDTVRVARYQNRLFWIWGDTSLFRYPLGLFHTLGATTADQPLSRFQPPLEIQYRYFTDPMENPRNVAEMPGKGPTWLGGLTSVQDRKGKKHLVAHYAKIEKPMRVYETGLCVWDDRTERFQKRKTLWKRENATQQAPEGPDGHVIRWQDKAGVRWLLFADPFPFLKCPDDFESWQDPGSWKEIEPIRTLESADGRKVKVHRGSITFHKKKNRWMAIFCEQYGESSFLGEIWYADAKTPLGPWTHVKKVLTHEKYSFYNPRICDQWMPENAEFLLFEGTYTRTFSRNRSPTPKYDYNQILYRVDFKDLGLDD